MDLPFEASSVVGVLSLHQLWVDNSRTWIRQKLWLWSLGEKKRKNPTRIKLMRWGRVNGIEIWREAAGSLNEAVMTKCVWEGKYSPRMISYYNGHKNTTCIWLSPSCIWITWRVRVKCELGSQLINRSHPPSSWPDSVLESLGKFQWRIRAKEGLGSWCLAQSTGFPYATVILGSGNGTSIDFCTRQISSSS